MSDLPKGWIETDLEAIVSFCIGGDWGKDVDYNDETFELVRVIRGTDYKTWSKTRAKNATHRKIKRTSLSTRQLEKGDIVVEISGGGPSQPVGRTILIDDNALDSSELPLVCSNFFRLLRVSGSVDSALINYCLTNQYNNGKFDDFQTQTTNLRNLNFTQFLTKTTIPLPPLNEQKRIVAKLEASLSRVDACKERLEKIPKILKRFRQSVLAAACSGKLTADWRAENNIQSIKSIQDNLIENDNLPKLPSSWKWSLISEIGTVKGGKRLPKGESLVDFDTGQPYIKAGNLKNGTVISEGIQYVPDHIKHMIRNYKVAAGNVFITIVGACIGDAGVVPKHFDGANLTENAAKIFNLIETDSDFLAFWLRSPTCQNVIQDNILSAAQGKLALFRIEQLPMPICSLLEQNEIVRRVEELFRFADSIEDRLKQAKAQVDKLTNSILAKAFRGELVEQDENDEPASVLLERIKANKPLKAARKLKKSA